MKEGLTLIALVLDKSGSMGEIRDDTIGAVNTLIEDQQKVEGKALFSLTLFDTVLEHRHELVPLEEVKLLNRQTYVPTGATALLDAVATTIQRTGDKLAAMDEAERPEKVVFVVQTDGQENSSREFTQEQVTEMVNRQRDEWSWQFMYLGAGPDAWEKGHTIGVTVADSMSHRGDQQAAAYAMASSTIAEYREGARSSTALNEDERDLRSK